METLMIYKILLATLLGGLVGLERQSNHKSSGIRTMALISLGSCVFALISMSFPGADPTRVIAQIVTGIGFLGAGIIFKSGKSVFGLTSAATIWCTAGLGVVVGIGMFQLSIIVTFLILIINSLTRIKSKQKSTTKDASSEMEE